jgi:hypothetical protein
MWFYIYFTSMNLWWHRNLHIFYLYGCISWDVLPVTTYGHSTCYDNNMNMKLHIARRIHATRAFWFLFSYCAPFEHWHMGSCVYNHRFGASWLVEPSSCGPSDNPRFRRQNYNKKKPHPASRLAASIYASSSSSSSSSLAVALPLPSGGGRGCGGGSRCGVLP